MTAPEDFADTLGELPAGVIQVPPSAGEVDCVVLFVLSAADLRTRFVPLAKRLSPAGGLWVAWPKKAAKLPTDLGFDTVQSVGLAAGLVDNKVCAIDATWSALRFVIRVADRARRSG